MTALFGHLGLEWDLAAATGAERAAVATWLAFVRDWRAVLHGGTVVRADRADPAAWLHGVVGADRALYAFVQLATSALAVPEPARLPGLDPDRRYAVRPAYPAGPPEPAGHAPPAWLAAGGVELPGRVLDDRRPAHAGAPPRGGHPPHRHRYPNVKTYASAPVAGKVISRVRSRTASCWRTSW